MLLHNYNNYKTNMKNYHIKMHFARKDYNVFRNTKVNYYV